MEFKTLVFYFIATILVLTSLRAITVRNPVHAALHLVLAFFSAGAIWILLHAEFLAIVLVLIYVGAVMVLFLFVIMMLDLNLDRLQEGFWQYLPIGSAVALIIVVQMGLVLWVSFSDQLISDLPTKEATYSNVKEIGRLLFTQYAYPFELASVVLLVGIVAAIALTLRGKKKSKASDPSDQVFVKAKDRVRVLKIPAEKKTEAEE